MKVGLTYSDLITTVSPTYAQEIKNSGEFGYGLEGVLQARSQHLIGILNGIDQKVWSPETDPLIAARYSSKNLSGKTENKIALLKRFGLDTSHPERPLLAMISRIDVQKGFDLLISVLDYILSKDLYFALLGAGNKDTEGYLRTIVSRYPGKAGMRFEFDNGSAHITEAGADIFLMPSKYEPCGLNQMYSLRYGTVPVVRRTGGLADTVTEYDPATRTGTGFVFSAYDPGQFKSAIGRALQLWPKKSEWQRLMLNGMKQNFSWAQPAKEYVKAYRELNALPL
jgi:starch synthase